MLRRLPLLLSLVAVVAAASFFLMRPAPPPDSAAVTPVPAPAPAAAPSVPPTPSAASPTAEVAPRAEAAPRRSAPATAPVPAPKEAAAPTVAVLRIDSDVPGAQVFVDRQFIGPSPATAPDIKPGSHVINVTAPGFEGVSSTVQVEPGPRDIMVKLREVRLNASAQVVHKHRMGSCTGRLIATPQGLRYETSDQEDAFSTSLTSLETFEVDYLDKNLRIKPASGKRYDFTDPDGNADRLFVFHRDVDKARQRIQKGDPPARE